MVLLPYYENQALFDQVSNKLRVGATDWPAWGPRTSGGSGDGYPPWGTAKVPAILCPSDGEAMRATGGRTNYGTCRGDQISNFNASGAGRGIFNRLVWTTMADIPDGTSNTIALSERCLWTARDALRGSYAANFGAGVTTNPASCLTVVVGGNNINPTYDSASGITYGWERGCGYWWASGYAAISGFNTVLGPNSPKCGVTYGEGANGVFPPDSYHPGGVNGCMADGSVRFINQTIDTGNLAIGPATGKAPSVYGVWGAVGTKAAGEPIALP